MCSAPFSDQKDKGQGHMSHLNLIMSVVSCLFDRITSYMAYIQHMRGRCVVHHFQDERSKVKVIWIFRIFYRVLSVAPSLFQLIWYTQPMRSQCVVNNFQVEMSKVKVTHIIWSVRSMAFFLFDQIMSYVSYTQHMRKQCVAPHFQDERSKVKATRVISNVTSLTCITEATHKGTMCRAPLPDQRSRSHRSLQVLSRLFRDGTDRISIGLSVPVSLIHMFMH